MPTIWKRAGLACAAAVSPIAQASGSQGPGVGNGTASPELQSAVIVGFVAFFVMIILANIGRKR